MTLTTTLTDYIHAGFSGLWVETTEPDEAQREIARLCKANDWIVLSWDVAAGLSIQGKPSDEGQGDPLAPLTKIAHVADPNKPEQPTILLLHNYHQFLKNFMVVQTLINQVLQGKTQRWFFIVLSPVTQLPVELEKLFAVIEHPLPNYDDLSAIAAELDPIKESDLPNVSCRKKAVEAAAGLTRLQAEGAYALSLTRHNGIAPTVVWEVKAQTLKKAGLLELHRGGENFSDLGGLDALKTFCKKALAPGRGTKPRGILLLGVPGTGKSAFAKALGNETGRPTLILDVGSLMGSLVGQSESNTRQALRIADAMSPCILFVDEIEKSLSGVGSNGDSGVSTRLFGTLLTWLNDHTSDVFFIGTCNDISKLPPEFSRAERFDGIFFLDLPTHNERQAIWKLYLEHYSITDLGSPPHLLPDSQWTGAEIKACCRLSALLDIPLAEAAQNIVPVSKTSAAKISDLKNWADGRCLSASYPGVYRINHQPEAKPAPRRRLTVQT